MKKLLLVVAAAVGASVLKKNVEKGAADKDLWAEATGTKPGTPGPGTSAAPGGNPS